MARAFSKASVLTAILLLPAAAQADPIYDFSTLSSGTVTSLGPSETLSGAFGDITAFAYYLNGGTWTPSVLIARNETNDNGLGVCSEGVSNCSIGGTGNGDDNELSQLAFNEAIVLQRPADTFWTGLWLSSLDNGGTNNTEKGKLYWGNDLATLFTFAGTSFPFDYPEFGGTVVEGKLTLPPTFDPSALYVLFVPGGTVGQNNDYLVWGADIQAVPEQVVPEPASFLLVGSGLLALAHRRRRSWRSVEGRS